ncbi:lysine exporter protein LysE/YggA [Desulfovibrio ferrophilus]|uniref:Lysine exporter protein LysE/YggA n=1 Tax=Desulfovibrio ferrophilus TaxID=241368 RepID=A0A2Z6AUI8_9BACT|nr:lysine exporter protein LysE/YggA [Desulfovibrio ferrophilus]
MAILGTWLAAVVLPGPNFIATAHAAISGSRSRGLITAAGVACGTALWVTVSLAGLGVVLQTTAWLHQTVKWAGACYLIWVGVQSIRNSGRGQVTTSKSEAVPTKSHPFRRGLTVVLSNPKTAAFFTSLFAVAVPVDASTTFNVALGTGIVTISWCWYSFVACAVSLPKISALLAHAQRMMRLATGGLLIFFGLKLAIED